ncbi:MAG: porin [Methylophaga sp.]|nr:porin [Methylophaga sp.]
MSEGYIAFGAGAANAAIVVGGENGYEFSVDGNINQFYIYSDQDSATAAGLDQSNAQIANGLLPTFFGFNVSAPEINGLKVGARVSISPSTNDGSYFGGALEQGGGAMEQREAFATVDGSFGQILAGKALGLYSSNNILLDQTLFGVGATGLIASGDQNSAVTTLGRIGWGYDYANWRSQFRYTTPDMNGFKAAFAIVDAEDYAYQGATTKFEKDPRYEAQLSYATAFDGGSMKLWADYMSQKIDGETGGVEVAEDRIDAYTVGGQLILGGFEAVATYYDNEGQGIGGFGVLGGFETNGDAREGDGYYVQAGYRFAGKTFLAASYGESTLDRDNNNVTAGGFGDLDANEMVTVGIYHDVTANLKLVAEYSKMETEYYIQSDEDEVDVISLGGFVTW